MCSAHKINALLLYEFMGNFLRFKWHFMIGNVILIEQRRIQFTLLFMSAVFFGSCSFVKR